MKASWTGRAAAKINLSLDVLGKLPNGYHQLKMIMQTVSLYDTVSIKLQKQGLELTLQFDDNRTNDVHPTDTGMTGQNNLVYKAAEQFFRTLPANPLQTYHGAHITLTKRIPIAAGLAGGSADAAAVFRGLNTLFEKPFSGESLSKMGQSLGADIPYCLHGGTMLAEGTGEELTALPSFQGIWLVLVKPPFPVATAWVFSHLNLGHIPRHPDTNLLIQHITEVAAPSHQEKEGIKKRIVLADTAVFSQLEEVESKKRTFSSDTPSLSQQAQVEARRKDALAGLSQNMVNVLESVTLTAYPEIEQVRQDLLTLGALGARMSGSGPSVFGLFANAHEANCAQQALEEKGHLCWVLQTISTAG